MFDQNGCGLGVSSPEDRNPKDGTKNNNLRRNKVMGSSKTTSNLSQNVTSQKSCLSNAMLMSNDRVDVSGVRCNMIGTSTFEWGVGAEGLHFCDARPGHCMGNQLGPLRRVSPMHVS